MRAIRFARENGVPYLGICLGMQLATIEFARNVCGLAGANSTEFDRETPHPVVALITEWLDRTGRIEKRTEKSDLGGTMRLGAQKCPVEPDTLASCIYGKEVNERHRHRYEVNNIYVPQLEAKGYKVSARTPSENLPEMMELPGHPFFIGVQFHPEFTSTPRHGHPLFKAFVTAALRAPRRRQAAGRRGLAIHAPLRLRRRPRPAAIPHCRPRHAGERAALPGRRRQAEGAHRQARHALHLQGLLRQGEPHLGQELPRARHGRGSEDPGNRKETHRCSGPDRRARRHAAQGSRRGRRRDPDAGLPLPPDQLHPQRRQPGQAGQHQEGPVPLALGNEERGREGARAPATSRSWSASAASASATTTWWSTCAAWRRCATPAARWCSTRTHSVQLPGGQGTASGGQREFIPVLARAAVGAGRLRRVHGDAPEAGRSAVRRAELVAAAPDAGAA